MSNDNRPCTQEEATAILAPVFANLVAQHGKTEAIRMFKRAVIASGFDPLEFRVIFDEDIS